METLPFVASFDALAYIVQQIRAAISLPEASNLVPALYLSLNSTSWDDATGRILECIPYEHYSIGWYQPEDVTEAVEVDIWGRRVLVSPETLKRLAGKQLVLRTVDSGGRAAVEGGRQLLIAVALTPT